MVGIEGIACLARGGEDDKLSHGSGNSERTEGDKDEEMPEALAGTLHVREN